jgi:hypothetical protein
LSPEKFVGGGLRRGLPWIVTPRKQRIQIACILQSICDFLLPPLACE